MQLLRTLPFSCMISVLLAGSSATAQDPAISPTSGADSNGLVRLEAKDGQTHFRLGDLITLELVFSNPGNVPPSESQKLTPIQRARQAADSLTGQHNINGTDYGDLADTVTITPSAGWFQWQGKSGHDYMSIEVPNDHEIRMPLVLNQGYVFREPGHYEISVTTSRLDNRPLTTNSIGLDLTARAAEEEQALVRSLNAQLASPLAADCSGPWGRGNPAAEQLAALPGDDAVRAKVRWLLAEEQEDVRQEMAGGLAASRNYELQLQLLEDAWRNPQHTPDSKIRNAIENTRAFQAGKMRPGWQMIVDPQAPTSTDHRLADESHADLQAIVDSLPQRSGQNLADTAYFLIEFANVDPAQQAAVRPVVLSEFEQMDSMEQGMLLGNAWQRIRDPLLVPALRTMLEKPPGEFVGYGPPLERLIELDPASAKPYVVREICDPHSNVPMKQMSALPDGTLPETDACLLRQMTANAPIDKPNGMTPWPEKALIAGRFASGAIYPQVLALYRAHPEWNDTVRGATIAYLARWHPEVAAELLPSSTLSKSTYLLFTLNNVLAARHGIYPESLRLALRAWIAQGSDNEAEQALYNLSKFGTQDDAAVAVARLERLASDWNGRAAELTSPTPNPEAQAAFQLWQELVLSLWSKEGAWVLPDAERHRIKRMCLGTACQNWASDGEGWSESR